MNIEALETSFDLLAPRGDELVEVFYERLFDRAPGVRPLFAHVDMKKQRAMLLATLVLLRKSLRDLDSVAPKLREMGARHVSYGAVPGAYPIVGEVLIASMAQLAGDAWTNEHAASWAEAYAVVQSVMLDGAESVLRRAA